MLEGNILGLMYVLAFCVGIFVLCGLGALIVFIVQQCKTRKNNTLKANLLETNDSVV